jgi:hypothetical protein
MTFIDCTFLSILHRTFAFVCVFFFIYLIMEQTNNVWNQIIRENKCPLRLRGRRSITYYSMDSGSPALRFHGFRQSSLTIPWILAVTSSKIRWPATVAIDYSHLVPNSKNEWNCTYLHFPTYTYLRRAQGKLLFSIDLNRLGKIRLAVHVASVRKAHQVTVRKSERKGPLWTPRPI